MRRIVEAQIERLVSRGILQRGEVANHASPGTRVDEPRAARESGGVAPLARPLHKGFGMQLMEHMLPHELDARTVFGFPPSGARMLMMIPRFTVGRASAWAPDSGLQLLGSGPARG
jgi:hypothetical protein